MDREEQSISGRSAGGPTLKCGLPPIFNSDARTLILGTLPGEESLKRQEYYGHPRNQFWPVIAALASKPLPRTYAERVALLRAGGFALWDVLHHAERIGSLDSAIKNARPNVFPDLFRECPHIATIAFNGQKSHALFLRHAASNVIAAGREFRLVVLPSTSPAYVRPFDEKLAAWRTGLANRF